MVIRSLIDTGDDLPTLWSKKLTKIAQRIFQMKNSENPQINRCGLWGYGMIWLIFSNTRGVNRQWYCVQTNVSQRRIHNDPEPLDLWLGCILLERCQAATCGYTVAFATGERRGVVCGGYGRMYSWWKIWIWQCQLFLKRLHIYCTILYQGLPGYAWNLVPNLWIRIDFMEPMTCTDCKHNVSNSCRI